MFYDNFTFFFIKKQEYDPITFEPITPIDYCTWLYK
jgi:hypothetical protein